MPSSSSRRNLPWERFEELAKVAFVSDPHADTRFFLKTRVVAHNSNSRTAAATTANTNKKNQRSDTIEIVARVATRPRNAIISNDNSTTGSSSRANAQSITYETSVLSNVARLLRLLRFAMQEVLGPMQPLVTSPLAAGAAKQAAAAAAVETPPIASAAPPKSNKKSSKNKTNKNKNTQ